MIEVLQTLGLLAGLSATLGYTSWAEHWLARGAPGPVRRPGSSVPLRDEPVLPRARDRAHAA